MSVATIDYVAEPANDRSIGIEVAEFKPYNGLQQFFDRVDALKTAPALRTTLTMMLLELDSALQAQDGGNPAEAVRHHQSMLNISKDVFRQTAMLNGTDYDARVAGGEDVTGQVQKIFIDITSAARGVKNDDGTKKPWGRTLAAVVEEFKARNDAVKNLSLMPEKGYLPASQPVFFASPRHDFRAASKFDLDFTNSAKPEGTVWTRPEYKNLGIVLEQLSRNGQPARVDALVALSCLKSMSNREKEFVDDIRSGTPNTGAQNKSFAESNKRLAEYIGKLTQNEAIGPNMAANLQRWQKPVADYARKFEKISQGPSLLSKIFHSAASFIGQKLLKSGVTQALLSKPKAPVA